MCAFSTHCPIPLPFFYLFWLLRQWYFIVTSNHEEETRCPTFECVKPKFKVYSSGDVQPTKLISTNKTDLNQWRRRRSQTLPHHDNQIAEYSLLDNIFLLFMCKFYLTIRNAVSWPSGERVELKDLLSWARRLPTLKYTMPIVHKNWTLKRLRISLIRTLDTSL